MKRFVRILICSVSLIIVLAFAFNWSVNNKIEKLETSITPISVDVESLPVEEIEMAYDFDVYDKEKLVGFVDYMFIGRVEEVTGTVYESVTYNAEKNIYCGIPYTCYNVTVVENIKGELILNEVIPIRKLGGVSVDGESLYKYVPESMPKKDGYYLFLGYADANGELYVSDPNSAIELYLENGTENASTAVYSVGDSSSQFEDLKLIKEYKNAYKNQDLSERKGERYSSDYDVK